jgi:hypothetical protein
MKCCENGIKFPGKKILGEWTITNNEPATLAAINVLVKEPTGGPRILIGGMITGKDHLFRFLTQYWKTTILFRHVQVRLCSKKQYTADLSAGDMDRG